MGILLGVTMEIQPLAPTLWTSFSFQVVARWFFILGNTLNADRIDSTLRI
jgi:hypothetical protein